MINTKNGTEYSTINFENLTGVTISKDGNIIDSPTAPGNALRSRGFFCIENHRIACEDYR